MTVHVVVEGGRGCGYRKPGKDGVGIYLCGEALAAPCGRLPLPLEVCPCCSSGIKPSRGWTWITPSVLLGQPQPLDVLAGVQRRCRNEQDTVSLRSGKPPCTLCPAGGAIPEGRHGLLWVGEKFYGSPIAFTQEAAMLGVSRKLSALPRGFEVGKTWVYLAHRHAVFDAEAKVMRPGIFSAFRPTRVDLVIADAHNIPERAQRLAAELGSAARLVKVVRDVDTQLELGVAP